MKFAANEFTYPIGKIFITLNLGIPGYILRVYDAWSIIIHTIHLYHKKATKSPFKMLHIYISRRNIEKCIAHVCNITPMIIHNKIQEMTSFSVVIDCMTKSF